MTTLEKIPTAANAYDRPDILRKTRFGVISESEMRRNSAWLGTTFEKDIPYLWRKYREQVCDPRTGIDNEIIEEEILALADKLPHHPHEIVKARAFALVCEKVMIDVSPQDWFPAFGCWDRYKRPLTKLITRWNDEVDATKLKTTQLADTLRRGGVAEMWKDYDHSTPDWETVFALGFSGLRERARRFRGEREDRGELDDAARNYFDGIEITYTAILDTLDRFHAQALKRAGENKNDNKRLLATAACLQQLRHGPPTNTYEVLLLVYLYFMFSEHIDRFQVRSLGNLGVIVSPYFQADLESGRFTEAQIREFFAYFLMQWASINNYWGQPFYFGGTKANGESEINELSLLILDVYDRLGITTPKLQLKVAPNSPPAYIDKALDMIRRGHNSITFICEPGIRRAFLGVGLTEEEARTSVITGCYESVPRLGNRTLAGYINLLKPLELVFNNGIDPVSGLRCGIETGKVENFKIFDDFYAAYLRQLGAIINNFIDCCNDTDPWLHEISAAQVFSCTIENSLRTARDANQDGSIYNISSITSVGFASVVDALKAVKELVFTLRETTLPELRDALRANWEGYEKLRLKALRLPAKYGNGQAAADAMADALGRFIGNKINLRPNARGGFYWASLHPARTYISLGQKTGATPDGRKAGEQMSKNASPVMGMDTNGVTALVKSVTNFDTAFFPGDYPLDVMMHPATVAGDDGLAAMRVILKTYMNRNGTLLQFNIFDAKILLDAQKHPEKYEGLQVRICGWNVRFNDIAKPEQDAFIHRALHIAE